MSKQEVKTVMLDAFDAVLGELQPQWKRCFWTRPFGHVRMLGNNTCAYCGQPSYWTALSLERLQALARVAHKYPIAWEGAAKGKGTAKGKLAKAK